jgi:hypothetical protein
VPAIQSFVHDALADISCASINHDLEGRSGKSDTHRSREANDAQQEREYFSHSGFF